MINEDTSDSDLVLLEQWEIDAVLPFSSVMIAATRELVIVGDVYRDGCLFVDLHARSSCYRGWRTPDRVAAWEKSGFCPERGIWDLSVSTSSSRPVIAVAAKARYTSCWEGSNDGLILEGETHSVAVAPNGLSVAAGLGKWVLDSTTRAQAEVVIWNLNYNEVVCRKKIPGSCVTQLLWIEAENNAIYDSIYRIDAGLKQLVVATSVARDQRKGFVTLLDPQGLKILEISDIDDAGNLRPLAAWPEEAKIWSGGGYRELFFADDSFHDPWIRPRPDWAPRLTASHGGSLWISENKILRLQADSSQRTFAQIYESKRLRAEIDAEALDL